uniref:Uncharacterized protein n=1 Tax=Anguilla anguilla TaxID=7936 RepID=A0A0E9T589_ANGAN
MSSHCSIDLMLLMTSHSTELQSCDELKQAETPCEALCLVYLWI